MEDIVGVSFFGLLISAIVVAISGSRTRFTPRQRALWRGWGLGLIGGAVFAFGLVNVQLIHKSPRLVVEGNLWDIRDRFGSGTELNQFMITDAAGHAVLIRCRYSGPGLVQGERARVRYVAYNRKLVEMDMLTGPYQKWHLLESSGEQGWWWWVAMGAVCGFFAYRQVAKISHGHTTAP
jgi:drug/metabolite transporter (DMT)-like permease